ncbi:ATP-binding protein [Streptomyces sp. NPDC058864]
MPALRPGPLPTEADNPSHPVLSRRTAHLETSQRPCLPGALRLPTTRVTSSDPPRGEQFTTFHEDHFTEKTSLPGSDVTVREHAPAPDRWGGTFGDDTVAATIDRLVHHAVVHSLKGESYRMRGRGERRAGTC